MIDKQEFEQIFRRHYDGMFRLARRMLGSDEESKDVVSDVFAQLLNSHADLRSDTLQGFLLTSVRNRCVNLLVHKQREQAVQVELRPLQQETSQAQRAGTARCPPPLHRHRATPTLAADSPSALPAGNEVPRDCRDAQGQRSHRSQSPVAVAQTNERTF